MSAAPGPWIRYVRASRRGAWLAHLDTGASRPATADELRHLLVLHKTIAQIEPGKAREIVTAAVGQGGAWVLHNQTGPALVDDVYRVWCRFGQVHRDDDLPAIESVAPGLAQYWYQHGQLHRESDKPAAQDQYGRGWYRNGIRFRQSGGPTVESDNEFVWHDDSGHVAWRLHVDERPDRIPGRWWTRLDKIPRSTWRSRFLMRRVLQMLRRGGVVLELDEAASRFRLVTHAGEAITKWRAIDDIRWLQWIEAHAEQHFHLMSRAMLARKLLRITVKEPREMSARSGLDEHDDQLAQLGRIRGSRHQRI